MLEKGLREGPGVVCRSLCHQGRMLLQSDPDLLRAVRCGDGLSLPGIPIVERFDVESDAVPDRNTLARSYEYAVSLFRKAIDCHMTDESYLFTEAVAKTYLAKLYFWAEEWSEVIPLCEELLAVPSYALADRSVYTESIQSYGERLQEVIIRDRTTGDDDVKTLYDETFKRYLNSRPVNATLLKLFGAEPQKDVRWSIMCDAKRVNQKTVTARVRGSELHLMLARVMPTRGRSRTRRRHCRCSTNCAASVSKMLRITRFRRFPSRTTRR